MKPTKLLGLALVILLAVLLAFSACPAGAVDHDDGEAWIYDVVTSVDVGPYEMAVWGNITYEFKEQRTVAVGSQEYDANVLSFMGVLFGQKALFGETYLEAYVAVDGLLFETAEGAGIIREETNMLIDATAGPGSMSWSIQSMNRTVATYSPPYLSEFDLEKDVLGTHWTEEVTIDSEVTVWVNGTEQEPETATRNETYEITVDGNAFNAGTPIGYFRCMRLTIVAENGNYEERLWSDEVNGYVQMDSYLGGTDIPHAYETMSLVGYVGGEPESLSAIILIGAGFAVFAAAVLVVVVWRMKHPKGS